uniref:Ancylometin 1 n=1 Tax=Ancylometes rufus TaxID=2066573 RepID=A0A8D7ZR46_9ARAC|nr:Ancylometin 1 precursor [Ancylometes rufus]
MKIFPLFSLFVVFLVISTSWANKNYKEDEENLKERIESGMDEMTAEYRKVNCPPKWKCTDHKSRIIKKYY